MRYVLESSLLMLVVLTGCAHLDTSHGKSIDSFPFAMRGDDTRFRIEFGKVRAASPTTQRALADEEMCYLEAGPATIECFTFGSMLVLAADDGEPLVGDNPLDGLQPVSGNRDEADLVRTFGALSVIGASIERLPDALADYLGSDGENQEVAVAVTHVLLQSGGVQIPGYTRGGKFIVKVTLTDAGRQKLSDALAGRAGGGSALTSRSRRHRPHRLAPTAARLSADVPSPPAAR